MNFPRELPLKRDENLSNPEAETPVEFFQASSTNLVAIDEAEAFARRLDIAKSITDELQEVGLNIREAGGREFGMILAMGMNALMPEYAGSFLHERDTRLRYDAANNLTIDNPPDISLQQDVVRYFRDNSRLHEALVDCMALSCRVSDPFMPVGDPAVQVRFMGESNNSGDFIIGNRYFDRIDDRTATIYIPGCGISGLLESAKFLKKLGETRCPNLRFVLCDNHPYVAEVGARFTRYLGDPRIEFIPSSMGEVTIPNNTTHILLSFIEAAGAEALNAVATQAEGLSKVKLLAISGMHANEYSGLASNDVVQIFKNNGIPLSYRETVPTYSTHVVRAGKSVDFCDLSSEEARRLLMCELPGGPPPNTRSELLTNCPPIRPLG